MNAEAESVAVDKLDLGSLAMRTMAALVTMVLGAFFSIRHNQV
jgi:hypothetical protein